MANGYSPPESHYAKIQECERKLVAIEELIRKCESCKIDVAVYKEALESQREFIRDYKREFFPDRP